MSWTIFKFIYYANSAAAPAIVQTLDQQQCFALVFWWSNFLSLTGKKKQVDFSLVLVAFHIFYKQ